MKFQEISEPKDRIDPFINHIKKQESMSVIDMDFFSSLNTIISEEINNYNPFENESPEVIKLKSFQIPYLL